MGEVSQSLRGPEGWGWPYPSTPGPHLRHLAVISKLQPALESPEWLTCRVMRLIGFLGKDPGICTVCNSPDSSGVVGLWTPLWGALLFTIAKVCGKSQYLLCPYIWSWELWRKLCKSGSSETFTCIRLTWRLEKTWVVGPSPRVSGGGPSMYISKKVPADTGAAGPQDPTQRTTDVTHSRSLCT